MDNNGLKFEATVEGGDSPTRFNLKGHLRIVMGRLPIPVATNIGAARISAERPADAKVE